jgi:pantoate--beta-alanine ligase
MGYLHDGHASLLRQASLENDIAICSIFVNPTQFNNPEDFLLYPKDEVNDVLLLEKNGCSVLFAPEDDFVNEITEVSIDLKGADKVLEGEFRPGHFRGMVNIVSLLFQIVRPSKAYFGQKDFQQLFIVQKLAVQNFPEIEIVASATVREKSGLAMSSRNARLSAVQREQATKIAKALYLAKSRAKEKGSVAALKAELRREFFSTDELRLEYLEVVDAQTLLPIADFSFPSPSVVCVAAYAGKVRLIDNMSINS